MYLGTKQGMDSLGDEQLLTLLIGSEEAKRVLAKDGTSLRRIAEARPDEQGVRSLGDEQLLTLLIGSEEAKRVLAKNGTSLRRIAEADPDEIGSKLYTKVRASIEFCMRVMLEKMKSRDILTSPERTRKYLTLRMRNYSNEVFACLFLDNQHRLIAFEELFRGTIDGASVHPREVVKRTLYYNAAAVVLVHNHPSGSSEPSHADRRITEELKNALALIDVRVLDHFVVGETITSFTESNLL